MGRKVAGILVLIYLFSTLFSGIALANPIGLPADRLQGDDRFETAIEISKAYGDTAKNVVLVNGIQIRAGLGDVAFADALAGAPLAAALDAPILLVRGDRKALQQEVKDRLFEMKVKNVYILGGENAVSKEIEEELSTEGYNVIRLAGKNRYETAVKVAQELKKETGKYNEVFITKGLNFRGSLAISAYAAQSGIPILFADDEGDLSDILPALAGVDKVTVVGTMDEAVIRRLESVADQVKTIDAHSIRIAREYYKNPDAIYVARGDVFADALVVGPLAAAKKRPVILLPVGSEVIPNSFLSYMDENLSIENVIALGGPAAVTDAALSSFTDRLAVELDKLEAKTYTGNFRIKKAGVIGPETGKAKIEGNLIINVPGVTLKNVTVEGNLIFGAGIGDGDAVAENVTVTGTTYVRGGGPNSVVFVNFNGKTVKVEVPDGAKVRLVARGTTTIENTEAGDGARLVEEGLTGDGFMNIQVPEGAEVVLAGDCEEVVLAGNNSKLIIEKGRVATLTVPQGVSDVQVETTANAVIGTLHAGGNVEVKGNGTIQRAVITAEGVTLEKAPLQTIILKGVSANVGGKVQEGDKTPDEINEAIQKPLPPIPTPPIGGGTVTPPPPVDEAPKITEFAGQAVTGNTITIHYSNFNRNSGIKVSEDAQAVFKIEGLGPFGTYDLLAGDTNNTIMNMSFPEIALEDIEALNFDALIDALRACDQTVREDVIEAVNFTALFNLGMNASENTKEDIFDTMAVVLKNATLGQLSAILPAYQKAIDYNLISDADLAVLNALKDKLKSGQALTVEDLRSINFTSIFETLKAKGTPEARNAVIEAVNFTQLIDVTRSLNDAARQEIYNQGIKLVNVLKKDPVITREAILNAIDFSGIDKEKVYDWLSKIDEDASMLTVVVTLTDNEGNSSVYTIHITK